MKKTSRRKFGQLIAGAVAAIPVASIAAQTPRVPRAPGKTSLQDILNHENTPPPIMIEDGSFQLKIKHVDTNGDPMTRTGSGTSWTYKGNFNTNNNFAHLRVMHGSGEMLYSDLNAAGAKILITLEDEDHNPAGNLVFEGSATDFIVTSNGTGNGDADGKLDWSKAYGKPKSKHRWVHKGRGNSNKDFRISRIIITKTNGAVLAFDVQVDLSQFASQDFRILAWLTP